MTERPKPRRLPFNDPRLQAQRTEVLRSNRQKTFSYQDLVDILSSKRSDPLARAFAEEFLKNSELKDIWQTFDRTHDLEAFAKALRSSGAFARFLERHRDVPGFTELAQDVAGKVPLARFAAGARAEALFGNERTPNPRGRTGPGTAKAARSSATSYSKVDEDFKYLTDPALAGLGMNLSNLHVLGIAYGLDAKEWTLLNQEMKRRAKGESSWDVCQRIGLLEECVDMVRRCMEIPGCVDLTTPTTPTTTPTTTTSPATSLTTAPTTTPPATTAPPRPCTNPVCPRDCGFCSQCASCSPPPDCASTCGNGSCECGETCSNCQKDCCPCGDGICTKGGRTPPEDDTNCPQDCPPPPAGCASCTDWEFVSCGGACGTAGACIAAHHCARRDCTPDTQPPCAPEWDCAPDDGCLTCSRGECHPACPQNCPPPATVECFCNRAPQGYCGGLGNCEPCEWGYQNLSAPNGICLTNLPQPGCVCPADCTGGPGPWVCQPTTPSSPVVCAGGCTTATESTPTTEPPTTTTQPCAPDGACHHCSGIGGSVFCPTSQCSSALLCCSSEMHSDTFYTSGGGGGCVTWWYCGPGSDTNSCNPEP